MAFIVGAVLYFVLAKAGLQPKVVPDAGRSAIQAYGELDRGGPAA